MRHFTRRDWLRTGVVTTCGLAASGWLPQLAAATAAPDRRKSIIVLWLGGGAATIDMWDLKPGHENGGPFQEIETAAAGVKISEHLPKVAAQMKDVSLIRSLRTREGDHGRASFLASTGYVPQGALQFPAFGSVVAKEFENPAADLPGFVSVAGRENRTGGGFLGPRYSPLVVGDGGRRQGNGDSEVDAIRVPDLERPRGVTQTSQANRLKLLSEMESEFVAGKGHPVVDSIQSAVHRAERLMRPEAAETFALDQEDDKLRDRYGRSNFGQGCLLARRLVERGTPFVEVGLGGWDSHSNNFETVKRLSGTLDAGFSTLIEDLKQRGLLDSTVILCLGEFGRTPKINGNRGRDHWPNSWAAAVAGGGIQGGRVVGRTAADGMSVEDRPVNIGDIISTTCVAVGIDPRKQNISNVSRPIRIADPDAKPIEELL